jgi:hypothetical protein
LFGGLGRLLGRVKHWFWHKMDIDKSKNAQIGLDEHADEEVGEQGVSMHMQLLAQG